MIRNNYNEGISCFLYIFLKIPKLKERKNERTKESLCNEIYLKTMHLIRSFPLSLLLLLFFFFFFSYSCVCVLCVCLCVYFFFNEEISFFIYFFCIFFLYTVYQRLTIRFFLVRLSAKISEKKTEKTKTKTKQKESIKMKNNTNVFSIETQRRKIFFIKFVHMYIKNTVYL